MTINNPNTDSQDNSPDEINDGEFSIVLLPDTQYYTRLSPSTFPTLAQWIADNASRYNIQAVLHVGDVVDNNQAAQWENANAAWDILDAAEIPYLLAIGNHDYDTFSSADRLSTAWNTFLPQNRYTGCTWWNGGFFEEGKSENAFLLLTIAGTGYIFLSLEFGPRDEVLSWANDLLKTYASQTAIIITHSYLYHDGTRVKPGTEHNPKDYELGATAHDGEDMWEKLVNLHNNVLLVLSGHHINGENAARRSDRTTGGSIVHQLFANWQDTDRDTAYGWLRLLTFGKNCIRVQTFSPVSGQKLVDEANEFELSYKL
ncbi:MAG: hypothetical protein EHM41_05705 [Chloroflexi bacterium]|nr:MAG: hypothetical protein EHM41_05705 [Chloroflexota bacterium]